MEISDGNGRSCCNLRCLHDQLPIRATSYGLLWNDHRISRLQDTVHGVSDEQSARTGTDHRTVGTNHECGSLVRKLRRSARLGEIPLGTLVGTVADCGRVINLTGNHDLVGLLRNQENVAVAHFDIVGSVGPMLYIRGNANGQASDRRISRQIVDGRLPLRVGQFLILLLPDICLFLWT